MKKMIQFALLGTVIGASTFASAGNLSVPLRVQEHSQWCWAASSKMVMDFKGKSYTQCAIANYAWGINYACGNSTFDWQSQANQPNSADAITRILNAGGTPATTYSNYLSQSYVNQLIDAQKPFVVLWSWTNGGGHFVVCKGYSGSTLYFNDPWPGNGSYTRTYSATVSSSDRRWTYTNVLR